VFQKHIVTSDWTNGAPAQDHENDVHDHVRSEEERDVEDAPGGFAEIGDYPVDEFVVDDQIRGSLASNRGGHDGLDAEHNVGLRNSETRTSRNEVLDCSKDPRLNRRKDDPVINEYLTAKAD
jgi:hypothetical protein